MATNSTPAAKTPKTPKEKKPQLPFMDRIAEQLKKQVLAGKVSNEELDALSERITKFKAIGEALKA